MQSYEVIEWGQPLQMRLHETPQPGPEEVLLKLSHCGACHSDVHIREGWFDLGGDNKLKLADRGTQLPLTLGHKPIGKVLAVGERVSGVQVGRPYLVNPWIGCGQCWACQADRDSLCNTMRALGMGAQGGFAKHLLVPHARHLVTPKGLTRQHRGAALLGRSRLFRAAEVRQLVRRRLGGRHRLQCVGLMALSVLAATGHARVIACDIDDAKLQAATTVGAAATVNLQARPGPAELLKISGIGLAHMVDFVGAPATSQLALPALAMREISVRGSAVGNTAQIRALVQMVREGKLKLPAMQARPLAQAEQNLRDLEAGEIVGGVALEAGRGEE